MNSIRRLILSLPLTCVFPMSQAAPNPMAIPTPLPPVFPIRRGDLHGLIDAQGHVLLAAEYDEINPGDPLVLVRRSARTAYADYHGAFVIAPQEALTQAFREGLTPAGTLVGGKLKYGYMDAHRQFALPAIYESADNFSDGLAIIGGSNTWGEARFGAIDRQGNRVIPTEHAKLLPATGGVIRAEQPGRIHRALDRHGRDITPKGVGFIGIAADERIRVWVGRLQGFMDLDGRLVVEPIYEDADEFSEGLARVYRQRRYGYIDREGRVLIEPRFTTAEKFSDGVALVRESEGDTPVFIDRKGRIVLRPKADRVYPFSQGLAVAKLGNKYGYIDKAGQWVIEARYGFARPFHQGLAYVSLGRSGAYIRPDGEAVWRGED